MNYYVFTFGGNIASYSSVPPTDLPYFLTDAIPPSPGSHPFDYILKVNMETEELWWEHVDSPTPEPQEDPNQEIQRIMIQGEIK